ncbi:uncharacterized protein LOC120152391 [Hibiscus syriacus]|uniref:uncharacterized protein LOC120152391 n=1 Tax=Hibiscus syriacus TaxID=106335 RepID=UPI0019230CB2|nr:uncharacterized protein LOC120152391 [Hibiscus syriacus]
MAVFGDNNGRWIVGFHRRIGNYSPLHVEFHAILDGLLTAWNHDARQVEVNTDNSQVAGVLNSKSHGQEVAILRRIRHILQFQWSVEFTHSCRELNTVVDALAHLGYTENLDFTVLHHPPDGFHKLLSRDMAEAC